MATFVLAIDQGTTSTRAMIFDDHGQVVAAAGKEHRQIMSRPGWVEHDPMEILQATSEVVALALARAQQPASALAAVGITNQRETTVLWDRRTGKPIHNALVWQDTRTADLVEQLAADGGPNRFAATTGLPLATYFAAPKIAWLLEHVDGAKAAAKRGDLLFGTIDTWLIWNLTGEHITDVTNASRTMLMDLRTLEWDADLLAAFGIPAAILPRIVSSAEPYGTIHAGNPLTGRKLTAALGDQQAAAFGQACFTPGMAKNTYGTGNFMLLNTGAKVVESRHGLLTTVAYQLGSTKPVYALEGSIAVTGSLVQWLRDNLGLIASADEIEALARSVPDNGGTYIVPAFSGLFAPHWRSDARGVIVGLTRFVGAGHLARATLEATAFQTREVVDAMLADSGVKLKELRVDGGMVVNDLLMQFQSDVLDLHVVRPTITETTALGAAYAAGIAAGVWDGTNDVAGLWRAERTFKPRMSDEVRSRTFRLWRKAVERTLNWMDDDVEAASAEPSRPARRRLRRRGAGT